MNTGFSCRALYVPPIVFGGKTTGGYGYAAIQHCQREINKKHPFSGFAERVLFARLCEFRRFVFCIYNFAVSKNRVGSPVQ